MSPLSPTMTAPPSIEGMTLTGSKEKHVTSPEAADAAAHQTRVPKACVASSTIRR